MADDNDDAGVAASARLAWDTDTATALIVAGALALLVLLRRGFPTN